MDAILDEIGDNQNIKVKYSTAKEFFEATYEANRKAEKELNLYEEDFFPYLFEHNEYWTGFYTTFPFFKKTVRQFSDYASSISFLSSLDMFTQDDESHVIENIEKLMESQAVMYHHDAITGTHTPETSQGYMRMIRKQYRKNFRHL